MKLQIVSRASRYCTPQSHYPYPCHYLVLLLQWDTAGQDRFAAVTRRSFYHKADGIILVYDITRRETFSRVRYWLSEIERNADAETCRMLVGNKSDRPDRDVPSEEGLQLARDAGIAFFETSARTSENVDAAFHQLARELVEKREPHIAPQPLLDPHAPSHSSCAC